jgi:predicted permease
MVIEGLLLAALGGAAGILIGTWAAHVLASVLRVPGDLPVRFDFGLDSRVVVYAVVIALGSGLAVSFVAGVRAASTLDLTLRQFGRAWPAGAGGQRLRRTLVILQVATCFVVLVAAGLLLRSLWAAERADLGFDPEGVLNVHMDVGQLGYTEAEGRAFFEDVERRVHALPAVRSASFAFTLPLGYVRVSDTVEAEGRPDRTSRVSAGKNVVGPRYFETMGIGLVRGRGFDDADGERSRPVAVVNQRLASVLWPDQDPIGRRFRSAGESGAWVEIVGVTGTGRYRFLFENPQPHFYVPIAQEYTGLRVLQVRSSLAPETMAPAIERTLLAREPNLPLYDVQSMTRALGGGPGFFVVRTGAATAATLGLIGLALAIVGIYGLVAQTTVQRRHEMGVRMAHGATRADVLRLILRDGSRFLVLGLGAGLVVALAGGNVLERFLFGVSGRDVMTLAVVSTILAFVAIVASAIPAWHAARLDPAAVLRSD